MGKEKTHAELRAGGWVDHHDACGCHPCETVRAILSPKTLRASLGTAIRTAVRAAAISQRVGSTNRTLPARPSLEACPCRAVALIQWHQARVAADMVSEVEVEVEVGVEGCRAVVSVSGLAERERTGWGQPFSNLNSAPS